MALAATVALYAPTLTRGLVNYDDPWLVASNWITKSPSWSSLHTIVFDLSRDTRAVLGAEFLPVRDLSMMIDAAIWGDRYAGFHLTNLVLYLAAIALWFGALCAFGVNRRVAGIAILLWALHPTHAESVAWITERKGVLSVALSGVAALGYARFRAGGHARWLMLAALAAIAAVWSKATASFTIAALAGFELALVSRRVSWRRSLAGLGVLGAVTAAAFVPVLLVASQMQVVAVGDSASSHGWLAMVVGVHGFYLRLAVMAVPNAVSYPISTLGPSTIDIVLGATWLVALAVVAARPQIAGRVTPPVLRAGALLWLIAWFPTSRVVLPVQQVVAADRYLLVPTLGVALMLAVGLHAIPRRSLGLIALVALTLASGARTLDAQSSWRDDVALWGRAVESNPSDGNAWNLYAEARASQGDLDGAVLVTETGLRYSQAPRLIMRRALLAGMRGDRTGAFVWMQRAAEAGEPLAMTNLAVMLFDVNRYDDALVWARKAVAVTPLYVNGHRIRGKVALGARLHEEARDAFARAYELEPANLDNRFNLGLAFVALGDARAARPHFEACLGEPRLEARARDELARLMR